jgi:signal transduction histidine kinase
MRNPLSSIKGAAQILQQEWGAEKPHNEFLSIILDEVDALTALTTEFLDFARPLYPELAWHSWNGVVQRAVATVQPRAEAADILIEVAAAEGLPNVLMDRYQVERAMRNLLINAMESSPRGAVVSVCTAMVGDRVEMGVTDRGCGVPAELIGRLFIPFFTTKVTGTGLGLPVARKIAQYHGGDVTGVRNDGPGMTFLIHLPASGDGAD